MNDSLAYVLLQPPVVFGKMALKIAAIVKDASHLNHAIVATAIEKEMSRLLHAYAAYSAPAERKMVSPRTLDHDLRPAPSSRAARDWLRYRVQPA